MRGEDTHQDHMFSYISLEDRVPENHPLRDIREMTYFVLERMSRKFARMYSRMGRPSIPPEQLLRALVLQFLYTIRSERMLMEQINYNLLFRWFVGLNADDPVWNPTVFSKNRDRFLKGDIATRFFREIAALARNEGLLSDEHFTVDGTLIESLASLKSFQPRGRRQKNTDDDPGNPTVNFRNEKRKNQTHQSTTDPEALLYRKGPGKEARLYYCASVLIENKNGLITDCEVLPARGTAEREAAEKMIARARKSIGRKRITLGADKGYDTRDFVKRVRKLNAVPHVAQNDTRRKSAIDRRTTRHAGYSISQLKRKRVEEVFGWQKTVGLMRKSRFIGLLLNEWAYTLSAAVYNMVRIRNITCAT